MEERRRSKRIIVKLKTEIVTESQGHTGFLENLSEEGIYMITAPANPMIDFPPGTSLELKFLLPSKELLNLKCKVKWSFRTPPHGLTNSMGLEIIDPPPQYMELLEALSSHGPKN